MEAIRVLHVGYTSAVKACTQTANQVHALVVTVPADLRDKLNGNSIRVIVKVCSRFRIGGKSDVVLRSYKIVLKHPARRYELLTAEISDYKAQLKSLCRRTNPVLLAATGIAPETAAVLLVAAGDNPQRLGSEASFAALCRVSPVEASSGRIIRHRFNRGGNHPSQQSLMAYSYDTHALRRTHPKILRKTHNRRQNPA